MKKLFYVSVMWNVEKRQELQYTLLLQETLETNKKSAEAKETFFSNMSHEMRTPLNAIIGFSKLALESGDMSDKNKEYIKKISFFRTKYAVFDQ